MKEFLENGEYLPYFLKDFHDQKSLFKRLNRIVSKRNEKDGYKLPHWVEAQIYTVDVFLWFMAKHGYTLQKSRKNIQFSDIDGTMSEFEKEQTEQKFDFLKTLMNRNAQ